MSGFWSYTISMYGVLVLSTALTLFVPSLCFSQTMNLQKTIETAIATSSKLKQSRYAINAAQESKKAQRTESFPSFSVEYDYIHRDKPKLQSLKFNENSGFDNNAIISPEEEFNFITFFSQPIFTGFELTNKYELSKLDVKLAELSELIISQDVILDAINAYFSVLKYRKLEDVAHDVLDQTRSLNEIAETMHKVEWISTNDLLTSKVKLASVRQDLIKSQTKVKIAESKYNRLLQRPFTSPVGIVDVENFTPFAFDLRYCFDYAVTNRIELLLIDKHIEKAETEYVLTRNSRYPDIDLLGIWTRRGDDMTVSGGEGISDSSFGEIRLVATWEFWDWGRTTFKSNEKLNLVSQAKALKKEMADDISLEVQEAYLTMINTEGNIHALEIAIDQADENLRITSEQYKQKSVTITEYLAAQTLRTETLTSYYNALYDFKIAKAVLYRSIGKKDPAEYVRLLKDKKKQSNE